jgi:hypothetical protein
MNEEQNWIENIEAVAARIERPTIPAHVLERIHAIPFTLRSSMENVSPRTIWLAAASIAALIAINLYVLNNSDASDSQENAIAETYFSHVKQL